MGSKYHFVNIEDPSTVTGRKVALELLLRLKAGYSIISAAGGEYGVQYVLEKKGRHDKK